MAQHKKLNIVQHKKLGIEHGMAAPAGKLASSLEVLKKLQDQGFVAIRSVDLTRTHRERLMKHGFLQEVMKGWYIPTRPDGVAGERTAWYASY